MIPIVREAVRDIDDKKIALAAHAADCSKCGLPSPGVVRVRRCKTGLQMSVDINTAKLWVTIFQYVGEVDA
jgi:hypothetical protein